MKHTRLREWGKKMQLNKGEVVLVSSDTRKMLLSAMRQNETLDLNQWIDGIIDCIGEEGTLLFPTYNWDFCNGLPFHYLNTLGETGSLGNLALKRGDFKRTKHPIYSFAVYGKDKEYLCDLENTDSFGLDSPFAYLHKKGAKNVLLDVDLQQCFTFVHYVEEQSGAVPYRFLKHFTSQYYDEKEHCEEKTYSMFVRDFELNTTTCLYPMEAILKEKKKIQEIKINQSNIMILNLAEVYPIINEDITQNASRSIAKYLGQDTIS